MSRMVWIRPRPSQNAMESGISVFFIQNAPFTGENQRNTIPALDASDLRYISPVRRESMVAAISTRMGIAPAAVRNVSVLMGNPRGPCEQAGSAATNEVTAKARATPRRAAADDSTSQ